MLLDLDKITHYKNVLIEWIRRNLFSENFLYIFIGHNILIYSAHSHAYIPLTFSSSSATPDDVEIVRLALLWTFLFWRERPALFHGFVNPSGFYCRLAETFLIGPEVFLEDQTSRECLSLLIDEYLMDVGQKGRLNFHLTEPIAGLDSFMAFYDDLLRHFEEFSMGDSNFSSILLIGAYMNRSKMDAILTAQALWSQRRNVARQILLQKDAVVHQNLEPNEEGDDGGSIVDEEEKAQRALLVEEHNKLMALYAVSLRDKVVMPERNPAMFAIASAELGRRTRKKEMGREEDENARSIAASDGNRE